MQLLTMTASSHPKTFFVMKLAARVGEVVMMRLKRHFNRPRPTQYFPTLYPPLPVPGHSSYPAGHAVIARADRKSTDRSNDTNGWKPPIPSGTSPYKNSLLKLADEIGRNRVIAGFHFRSDIDAGVIAADMTYQFLAGIRLLILVWCQRHLTSTTVGSQCCDCRMEVTSEASCKASS